MTGGAASAATALARLQAALAWIEVHGRPQDAAGLQPVRDGLEGALAVLDSGRALTAEEREAWDPGALGASLGEAHAELRGLLVEASRAWRAVKGAGRRRKRGLVPAPPRYFLSNGRPVRTCPQADGGVGIIALDLGTGGFTPAVDQLFVLAPAGRDVDELDRGAFYAEVDRIRRTRGLPSPGGPVWPRARDQALDWVATGDARRPLRAEVEGDEWEIVVNDWPDEPTVYSLWVNGREVVGFDDWPDAWTRP